MFTPAGPKIHVLFSIPKSGLRLIVSQPASVIICSREILTISTRYVTKAATVGANGGIVDATGGDGAGAAAGTDVSADADTAAGAAAAGTDVGADADVGVGFGVAFGGSACEEGTGV